MNALTSLKVFHESDCFNSILLVIANQFLVFFLVPLSCWSPLSYFFQREKQINLMEVGDGGSQIGLFKFGNTLSYCNKGWMNAEYGAYGHLTPGTWSHSRFFYFIEKLQDTCSPTHYCSDGCIEFCNIGRGLLLIDITLYISFGNPDTVLDIH